jgi:hypothetical protein
MKDEKLKDIKDLHEGLIEMNKKKIILPDEEGLTPEQEKEAEAQLEELLKKRIEKQKVLMKIREAKAKDNR